MADRSELGAPYQAYFRFQLLPFEQTADSGFFFAAGPQQAALAALRDSLGRAHGIVALIGDPGVGKSAVLDTLLSGMSEAEVLVVRPDSARIRADGLLQAVEIALGIETAQNALVRSDLELRAGLEACLVGEVEAGRPVLLTLDDAQGLPGAVFDELGWFASLRCQGWPLVHCLVAGPPQLPERMAIRGLDEAGGMIGSVHQLEPLSAEETRCFIEHRLAAAGWLGEPRFTAAAFRAIHRTTRGTPRAINQLCDRLLEAAYVKRRNEIDGRLVEAVREGRIRPLDEMPGAVAGARPADPVRRTAEARPAREPRGAPQPRPAALGGAARQAVAIAGRGWSVGAAIVLSSLAAGAMGFFAHDSLLLQDPGTRVGTLSRDLQQERRARETLRAEAARQGEALRATTRERLRLESRLAELSRERDRLAARLSDEAAAREAARRAAQRDAEAGRAAEAEIETAMRAELERLTGALARLSGERDALKSELETALAERATLEAEVAALAEAPPAPTPAAGGAGPETAGIGRDPEAELAAEPRLDPGVDSGVDPGLDPKIARLAARLPELERPELERPGLERPVLETPPGDQAAASPKRPPDDLPVVPDPAPRPQLAERGEDPQLAERGEDPQLAERGDETQADVPPPGAAPAAAVDSQTAALRSEPAPAPAAASGAPGRTAASGPGEFMEHLGDRVAALYRGGRFPPEERQRRLRGLLHESVDLSDFSASILGAEWQDAGSAERAELLSLIEGHLFNPLINILEADGVRGLEVLDTSAADAAAADGGSMVTTRLETGSGEFHELGWEVRSAADGFRAVDLRAKGVSLLAIFQSELRSYVALNGAGALLQTLRARSSSQTSERPVDSR